jgi:hypothetical protein
MFCGGYAFWVGMAVVVARLRIQVEVEAEHTLQGGGSKPRWGLAAALLQPRWEDCSSRPRCCSQLAGEL